MVSMLRANGTRIKILRIQRGWPREELARIARVNPRTVQRLEAGGNASVETLKSLATAFEMDADELMQEYGQTVSGNTLRHGSSLKKQLPVMLDLFSSVCMPYVPAAKGILSSFALVVLVAFTIRLSPLLISDLESEIETVEPAQLMAQLAPAVAAVSAPSQPAGKAREGYAPSAAPRNQARIIPAAIRLIRAGIASVPEPQRNTPQTPAAERPRPPLQPELAPPRASAPAMTGGVDIAWLASLVEPETAGGTKPAAHAPVSSRQAEPASPPPVLEARVSDVPGQETAGGNHPLVRAFIWSGKGPAIFFAKVGGSIKKAF